MITRWSRQMHKLLYSCFKTISFSFEIHSHMPIKVFNISDYLGYKPLPFYPSLFSRVLFYTIFDHQQIISIKLRIKTRVDHTKSLNSFASLSFKNFRTFLTNSKASMFLFELFLYVILLRFFPKIKFVFLKQIKKNKKTKS